MQCLQNDPYIYTYHMLLWHRDLTVDEHQELHRKLGHIIYLNKNNSKYTRF